MTYVLVIYVNMLYLAVAPILIYSTTSLLYLANLYMHTNFIVPLKFLSPYITLLKTYKISLTTLNKKSIYNTMK